MLCNSMGRRCDFFSDLPQHEMDQIIREIEKLGFILSSVTDLEYYLGIKIEFQEGGRVI